jgi:hypothetical protein
MQRKFFLSLKKLFFLGLNFLIDCFLPAQGSVIHVATPLLLKHLVDLGMESTLSKIFLKELGLPIALLFKKRLLKVLRLVEKVIEYILASMDCALIYLRRE